MHAHKAPGPGWISPNKHNSAIVRNFSYCNLQVIAERNLDGGRVSRCQGTSLGIIRSSIIYYFPTGDFSPRKAAGRCLLNERSGVKKNETLNAFLIKSTIVAALGGLLFGFDTAVIAGATGALVSLYRLTPASLGLTVAIALWGTIIGAMLAGIPGDRYGRRDSLRGLAILFFVSALGCAVAWSCFHLLFVDSLPDLPSERHPFWAPCTSLK
jgi:Sugar (and other) transporter